MLKIISGGQTGVDRAALDVALELGLPHGGCCPLGRRAEDGCIPDRYLLNETDSPRYEVRTRQNVLDSDATLILCRGELRGGTKLTHRIAKQSGKPCLVVKLDGALGIHLSAARDWLDTQHVQVLNIAGPRASQEEGIADEAANFLRRLFGDAC